jgi:hypothetical protein
VQKSPRRDGLLLATCIGVWVIGYLDYVTGPSISMTLFYLAPVAVAGWTLGQRRAIAVAFLAGAVSLVDAATGTTGTAAFVWNVVSRTCLLAIAAFAVERIRRDRERLVMQDAYRARSLQLLDLGLADPAAKLQDLAEHWTGSLEDLKAQVRRRADEMTFLARDFSAAVRLENSALPLRPDVFDFVELADELRSEQGTGRQILMTAPSAPLRVTGDRARSRQVLSALIAERAPGEELTFLVDRRQRNAELVISSGTYQPTLAGAPDNDDNLGLSVELARLVFKEQDGSVELSRNPLTRSLRITARLPLVV